MMKITNTQKKYLRVLANGLKPIITIGKNGLSENVLLELESSMKSHELLKIKLSYTDQKDKQQIIDEIIKYSNATLVQIIGGSLTIYKNFEKNPVILLPRK